MQTTNSNNADFYQRGKFWLLTINAEDDDTEGHRLQASIDDIEDLHDNGEIEYAVGQYERGSDTGRMHIQAYLVLKQRKYLNWLKARVPRAMFFLSRPAWVQSGIKYCHDEEKEGFIKWAFEFGERPSSTQGKRTDLATVDQAIKDNELFTYRDVNDFRVSVAANHPNWSKWRLAEASKDRYLSEARYDSPYKPYVWQYWLNKYLTECKPSERSIVFLVDKLGHCGKTRFTHEFERNSGKRCQYLRAMPKRDMVAAMEQNREVLFIDVPRGRHQFMDTVYVFMEEAKDGKLSMEKYNSHVLYQARLHVVVFLNGDVDVPREDLIGNDSNERDIFGRNIKGQEFHVPRNAPPLTHDRYLIWDNEVTPELNDEYREDHSAYGSKFPPFTGFDRGNNRIEIVPAVKTSGPEFNGDQAGDGPRFVALPDPLPDYFLDSYVRVVYMIREHSCFDDETHVIDPGAMEPVPLGNEDNDYWISNYYLNHGETPPLVRNEDAYHAIIGYVLRFGFERIRTENCPEVNIRERLRELAYNWAVVPGESGPELLNEVENNGSGFRLIWSKKKIRYMPIWAQTWCRNEFDTDEDLILWPYDVNIRSERISLMRRSSGDK